VKLNTYASVDDVLLT